MDSDTVKWELIPIFTWTGLYPSFCSSLLWMEFLGAARRRRISSLVNKRFDLGFLHSEVLFASLSGNHRQPVGSLETENNTGRMKIRGSILEIMVPSQTKVLVLGLVMSLNEWVYVYQGHFTSKCKIKRHRQVEKTWGTATKQPLSYKVNGYAHKLSFWASIFRTLALRRFLSVFSSSTYKTDVHWMHARSSTSLTSDLWIANMPNFNHRLEFLNFFKTRKCWPL